MNKEKVFKIIKIIGYIIAAVQIALSIRLGIKIHSMAVLPLRYFVIMGIFLTIIALVVILMQRFNGINILLIIFSIATSIMLILGYNVVDSTDDTVNMVTNNSDVKTVKMNIIVLKDDAALDITGIKDYKTAYVLGEDETYTKKVLKTISDKKISIEEKEFKDSYAMIEALYKGEVKAVIIKDAYLDILKETEQYDSIDEDTRIIYNSDIKEVIKEETNNSASNSTDTSGNQTEGSFSINKKVDVTKEPFVVYISGIDTNGSVTTTSRSDVNILAAVNPVTKKILLINTPRDYYVPLTNSNGVRDKLTHAGIYGIDVSMGTLSMLYGCDVNYFVRMNFTGFTNIINALGGVSVNSEFDFSAGGYSFVKGVNELNGKKALVFARERHAFASGDRQRGKNQMEVIRAMIVKMASSSVLKNYEDVMASIAGSFQTNLSSDEIYSLVNMQLDNMVGWDINNISVDGTGKSSTTYSMPNYSAYVMVPDENSMALAKSKLNDVLNGK
jgi:LCP family protein required for cell wall assembly